MDMDLLQFKLIESLPILLWIGLFFKVTFCKRSNYAIAYQFDIENE